jgi:acetylornithine/succinyldiaminopimelate/putrescine aminotransferase
MNENTSAGAGAARLSTLDLVSRYTVPNYGRLALAPVRGEGSWLWDEEGKRYLDFGGGVAVCSLGHCPPVMTEALERQGRTLIHCSNWYQIRGQGELGQFLVESVMEAPGKCFFCNSGAEANEALLKLARKFGHLVPKADGTPRRGIITFHGSFHGRTFGGISATGQDKVKTGFGPLLEGFQHLPFNDVRALETAFSEDTVAVLLEPVQGEGGVHVATEEFLRACEALCRRHNALLLMDEVQCGLGRAGHWCGWKPAVPDLVPDAVSWAKGIAGGCPFGGVWISARAVAPGREETLCDVLGPGSHGTTYGGNPLGCAVALAVLGAVASEDLCAAAARTGARIMREVRSWRHPLVREVRGLGLLIGFELDVEALEACGAWRSDDGVASLSVVRALMDEGLLTVAAGPTVVRWLPPLNVSAQEVDLALGMLRRVLERLHGSGNVRKS